jgi:hypothetical protein
MIKVFIGGSRHVLKLATPVRERIDKIVGKNLQIIVGDANGVDKAVQEYLFEKSYNNVEVFCSGPNCRNNVGRWPLRRIDADSRLKGAAFFAEKDRAMTQEATYGFMIWDGKSTGTLLNVLRLLRRNKKVVVFNAGTHEFAELASAEQWGDFLAPFGSELRSEAERKASMENRPHGSRFRRQPQLIPSD